MNSGAKKYQIIKLLSYYFFQLFNTKSYINKQCEIINTTLLRGFSFIINTICSTPQYEYQISINILLFVFY